MLVPIVIILCLIFLRTRIAPKIIYLIGSPISLILLLFAEFTDAQWATVGVSGGADAVAKQSGASSLELSPGLGFWLMLAVWIAIIGWTLIRDFAINKALKEKGLKGAISDIASQTMNATNLDTETDSNVDFGSVASNITDFVSGLSDTGKVSCPSCGKKIRKGDLFCTYCGAKTENKDESQNLGSKQNERITVSEYIKSIKDYTCDNCGEKVTGNDKFCPSCGKPVIFKVTPETCDKCGNTLTSGYTFCPSCGAEVVPVILETTCKKCGAELLYGKDFCVNCGTKVGMND